MIMRSACLGSAVTAFALVTLAAPDPAFAQALSAPSEQPAPVVRRIVHRRVLLVRPPARLAYIGPTLGLPADPIAARTVPVAPAPAAAVEAPALATDNMTGAGRRSRGRHRDMVASAEAHPDIDALIAIHARANKIPESIVHRIVVRESRYNPRAVGRGGAMGLMQIKHATARGMGYTGPASGLLDADTNLRYAVPYLAGAYRVADGNPDRTVSYYAKGYYYAAKGRGFAAAKLSVLTPADTDGLTQAQRAAAARPSLFSIFTGRAKPVDPNPAPAPQ